MNYLLVIPNGSAKAPGGHNVFPVGIAYISASLKRNNHHVFTANIEYYNGDTYTALKNLIEENRIDVVCSSGLSRDYYKVKNIIDTTKSINPDIITIVGGGILSSDPETAAPGLGVDIGVIGEGEVTMCELAHALDNKLPCEEIKGLIYKDRQNHYRITGRRAEIEDIDTIPFPDYEGFNYSRYMEDINFSVTNVVGSRSCPFNCTFCFHPSGRKYRQRSLDNLFMEIDLLLNKYNVKNLGISDELFASNKNRVIEFCKRISNYQVNWGLQLRVSDVDRELLKLMRNSGCVCVSYGLESMDDTVLQSMKKHITANQIEKALKLTYEANIEIQGCFIFGDVAETPDTAAKTLQWYDEHAHYGIDLNMINIFPGTRLYIDAAEQGIIKDKLKFLKEECPLVNVSTLTDVQYKTLASLIYEKNMRPKYAPKVIEIKDISVDGDSKIEIVCSKCQAKLLLTTNILHWKMITCLYCKQRHYVDPFDKLLHSQTAMAQYFESDEKVAAWGAGEICIKILDTYTIYKNDNFKVVDISVSRQGYSICGKKIFSPGIIQKENIQTVIIAVVNRKEEIIKQLYSQFKSVKKIYLPDFEKCDNTISFILRRLS